MKIRITICIAINLAVLPILIRISSSVIVFSLLEILINIVVIGFTVLRFDQMASSTGRWGS